MKCERGTKLGTHGERDPHYRWMVIPTPGVVRLPHLAHPIIHGGRSLITYSTIDNRILGCGPETANYVQACSVSVKFADHAILAWQWPTPTF